LLSNKQKRTVYQILPYSIIPAIFSAVHVLLEKGILGDHPIYPSTGNPFDSNILISFITSFFIGTFIGLLEVFYVDKWFQYRKFYQKLIFKSIIYIIAIIVASFIIIVLGHSISQDENVFSPTVWAFVSSFYENFVFWSIICYYSLAIIVAMFYKEVSDSMGHSASLNFFTGKYHKPKSENRVFMFLDMKSSTAHAEKLGHIKYFQMLKEYYNDLSESILNNGGDIYQYVGDEVVVSWNAKKNVAKKVLDCFFDMKTSFFSQEEKYLSTYSVVPKFKAGIHYGNVTAGEIGSLKKEIVFTGDTLNTTARIQSLCNDYKVDILVSEAFVYVLEAKDGFDIKFLEEVQLRGRNQETKLYTVQKIE